MKLNLSKKIAFLIGILIIAVSLILGVVSVKLSSDALLKEAENSMQEYAQSSSTIINQQLSNNLAILNEVAMRARTITMDWATQRESLTADIERLGYLDMAVVKPDGTAQYVASGETADLADREYIKKALSGESNVSDVLISKVTGEPVVMEAVPIQSNGQIVGVLIGRRDGNFLSGITNELGLGERGYSFIMGPDSTIYSHPNKQEVLDQANVFAKIEEDGPEGLGAKLQELGLGTSGIVAYVKDEEPRIIALEPIPGTDWTLGVGTYKSDIMAGITALRNIIIFIAFAVVAIGIVVAFIMGRYISKPIRNLSVVADRLAIGDVDVEVNATSKDEIGDLMNSFGKMIDSVKKQAEASQRIAKGDLELSIEVRSEKDVLGISMSSVIDTLKRLVAEAEELTAAAVAGRLDTRGDAGQFAGGYKEIITGFNETLDAVINPLNMVAEHVEQISRGDIPENITDEYQGDFNTIKQNLNACI
ncbi:MAG: HAMP domain-containing protein, partial [Clostridia bacterium]|nr:HAMP domain-containing protein [Clostridia bacterium]